MRYLCRQCNKKKFITSMHTIGKKPKTGNICNKCNQANLKKPKENKKQTAKEWNRANPLILSKTKGLSALEQFHHYCDNTK